MGKGVSALQIKGALAAGLALVAFYWISVRVPRESQTLPNSQSLGSVQSGKHRAPKSTVSFPIDINRASASELQALPGIGPALAERIVQYRTRHRVFKNVGELQRVSGIGEKKLAQVRQKVIVGSAEGVVLPAQRHTARNVQRIGER